MTLDTLFHFADTGSGAVWIALCRASVVWILSETHPLNEQ